MIKDILLTIDWCDKMKRVTPEENAEREARAMKSFDYAETPIKELIAAYLNMSPELLFDPPSGVDGIVFEYEKKYWRMSLSVKESYSLDINYWTENKKFNTGVKALLEAVELAYQPIANTIFEEHKEKIRGFYPDFHPETLSFSLKKLCLEVLNYRMNEKLLTNAAVAVKKMQELLEKLENKKPKMDGSTKQQILMEEWESNCHEARQKIKQLQEKQTQQITRLNAIDKVDMKEKQDIINAENEKLLTLKFPRMYVCIEPYEHKIDDMTLKHMPVFSRPYEDMDDDIFQNTIREAHHN